MLQDHPPPGKVTARVDFHPAGSAVMEFAKAAFDAGNELAALDAKFLSRGLSDVAGWADLTIAPWEARHRAFVCGKKSSAIAFVKSRNVHFERYAAAVIALTRDHVALAFDGIETDMCARAVELLAENGIQAWIGPVRNSCALVRRDFAAGRGHHYWYPLSSEILDYFPGKKGPWRSHFRPTYKDGIGWHFTYGRH